MDPGAPQVDNARRGEIRMRWINIFAALSGVVALTMLAARSAVRRTAPAIGHAIEPVR